ncbi:hypothetical protein GH714_025459 [Hevea brasiliensis]|uniref:DUF3444 domain-containing protein n=1 Tax=Hevea brasiliensis TaxID=3981 RepID=A0A6A6MD14_HEVBR|nr:hypothetical protein GH714_025459 [Hevea brasiliensis]
MIICDDLASAREHLLRAHQLFPQNDKIGSMLTLCDTLTAARVELPGCGIDHYWVLQVTPSSSMVDIGCQYQKLVTLLQLIRTQFPCTELALKLLKDALIVLEDHKKRSEFDLKRITSWENYRSFDLQTSIYQSSLNEETNSTSQSSSAYKDSSSQICGKGGKATEMLAKYVSIPEANQVNLHGMDRQQLEICVTEPNWPSAGQVWSVSRANLHHNYRYAQIDSISKAATCVTWLKPIPVTSSERRWCNAGLPVACGSFELSSEMRMNIEVRWPVIASYKCPWARGVTKEQFEIYPKRGEIWAVYKDWNLDYWSYNPDSAKGCKFEIIEIISDFSKYLGLMEHAWFKGEELDKVVEGMFELDQLALPDYMIEDASTQKAQVANKGKLSNFTFTELPSFNSSPESQILMPGWSHCDFITGQVWAVYWGKDFMPRKYVRINNVTSEKQVYVTFLEPLPVLDHEIEWISRDLPMVCGIFKVGGRSANIDMSLFSYLVKCKESASNSSYEIYPLKGETWAMYKGWNAKWKMADYRSYQCQIVQILSDFSEGGDGMTISTLEQVKGCLTFFHARQCDGVDLIHGVSRAENLVFPIGFWLSKCRELASMAYQKTLGIWNHLRCPRRGN